MTYGMNDKVSDENLIIMRWWWWIVHIDSLVMRGWLYKNSIGYYVLMSITWRQCVEKFLESKRHVSSDWNRWENLNVSLSL